VEKEISIQLMVDDEQDENLLVTAATISEQLHVAYFHAAIQRRQITGIPWLVLRVYWEKYYDFPRYVTSMIVREINWMLADDYAGKRISEREYALDYEPNYSSERCPYSSRMVYFHATRVSLWGIWGRVLVPHQLPWAIARLTQVQRSWFILSRHDDGTWWLSWTLDINTLEDLDAYHQAVQNAILVPAA
jgi:hypothetical protein